MEEAIKKTTDLIEHRVRLCSLIAPTLLAINCVGIICSLTVLVTLSMKITDRSGIEELELVKTDYQGFSKLDGDTRATMSNVKILESQLNIELSQQGVLNATNHMLETEETVQIFLRLLKVNMYNLTGFIQGTASWYELYVPNVDDAIERSRSRQLKLLTIKEFYANGD